MKIGKTYKFEAAHQLPDQACYGKCSNLHGHSYVLEVEVEGPITNKGWAMNFSDLPVDKLILGLDHTFLNDKFSLPTAEVIALSLAGDINSQLPLGVKLSRLRLWETAKCYVEASPKDL